MVLAPRRSTFLRGGPSGAVVTRQGRGAEARDDGRGDRARGARAVRLIQPQGSGPARRGGGVGGAAGLFALRRAAGASRGLGELGARLSRRTDSGPPGGCAP